MKKPLTGFLLGLMLLPQVSLAAPPADIIIDTKMDADWSRVLVQKIRRLLDNYGYSDPFKGQMDGDIVLTNARASTLVSPGGRKFITELGDVLGLRLMNATGKVTMKNFRYEIDKVSLDVKPDTRNGVVLNGDFSVGKVHVQADEIKLVVEIPNANNGTLPLIEIVIQRPWVENGNNAHLDFKAGVQLVESPANLRFKVINSSFTNFAEFVDNNPDAIQLGFDRFIVPAVTVEVGNRRINVDPLKVEKYIRDREDYLKALILEQFTNLLKTGGAQDLLKLTDQYKVDREHWFNADDIQGQVNIGKVASAMFTKNLEVALPSDFCTTKSYEGLKNRCMNSRTTPAAISRITPTNHQNSMNDIKRQLQSGQANLIGSISEDYINKLLVTTYDAGYWKDMLEESEISIGPGRMFVRFDKKGPAASLFLDIIYKTSGLERFVTGAKKVQFPLKMMVSMRVEKHRGMPVFLIKMDSVELDPERLLRGYPEVGLTAAVQDVPRFKKVVIKAIKKKLEGFIGKDIISLDYPELKGMGLETVDFNSDGNGRINAIVKIQDLLSADEDLRR